MKNKSTKTPAPKTKKEKAVYDKKLSVVEKNIIKGIDSEIETLKKIYKNDENYSFDRFFKPLNKEICQMYYAYGKYKTLVPYHLRHK